MDIKISDDIKYIGVSTRDIDLFESQYIVPNGMAYNSYVILDDKIAVMDTADKIVGKQWLSNLKSVLGGRKPDYLVVQHLEPDHSANIQILCELYPEMRIICSAKAKAMLPQFADVDETIITPMGEGEKLNLGKHTLSFILAPMVHWPEVMHMNRRKKCSFPRTLSENSGRLTPTKAGRAKREDTISISSENTALPFKLCSKKRHLLTLKLSAPCTDRF